MHIQAAPVPTSALLSRYRDGANYLDSYTITVPASISLEAFVRSFYSTWLFKIERHLLRWIARRPSHDRDVERLARGESTSFAAWRVEARESNEILLCDFLGNTRSWLKVEPQAEGTRLFFGSAVVATKADAHGRRVLGTRFRALLGFHRRYSVALLRAAVARLEREH